MWDMIRSFILFILILGFIVGPAQSEPLKNLTEVGIFTTSEPHDAEFYKDYMFIADGNSLLVYNVSNPEKPRLLNKVTDFDSKVYGISILEESPLVIG